MKRLLACTFSIIVLAAFAPGSIASASGSMDALRHLVRSRIGDPVRLSQGARTWLAGPQSLPGSGGLALTTPSLGSNVDAANPREDLAGGQSETSVGAIGQRVLAAWNDVTGFVLLDTTQLKASGTGVGYSPDGGRTFRDLVGLPNDNPDQQWVGDPSVVAIDARHFIVGSLYFPSFAAACTDGNPAGLDVAVSIGTVNAAGTGVDFTAPVVTVNGGNVCARRTPKALSLLDKPFLSYDSSSRTLAMSYTRFFLTQRRTGLGQIEVVRAHVPSSPETLTGDAFRRSVVWREESNCRRPSEAHGCGELNSGSYPAVAPNGDVYVAWERNLLSNLGNDDPYVYIHAALVPAATPHRVSGGNADPVVVTSGQRNSSPEGGVKSLDGIPIAGYSRGLGNDFPRIVYDAAVGKPVVVWNDASAHPLGDIWMRSLSRGLGSSDPISRVNGPADFTLHFLPAVSVRSDGTLCSSWYDRRFGGPDSAETDYVAECRPSPSRGRPDFRVTTGSTDWLGTSSLIDPNFGDYTDNTSTGTKTYFNWSDGRLGVPQPFVDSRG